MNFPAAPLPLLIAGVFLALAFTAGDLLLAQAPPTTPAAASPAPQPSPSPAPSAAEPTSPASSPLDALLNPSQLRFDSGTDTITWNGQNFNISNLRLFRARFEKYLNAAEQTTQEDLAYQGVLDRIRELIAPQGYQSQNLDAAWQLLPQASGFAIDANLCDSLANAVYSAWLALNEGDRLQRAVAALEQQRQTLEWNAQRAAEQTSNFGSTGSRNAAAAQQRAQQEAESRQLRLQPYVQRLTEVNTMMLANRAKKEATLLQAKIEFQTILMQFFLQRRFQHVLIGTQFYRHVFGDGDSTIRMNEDAQKLLGAAASLPPTLAVLESLANEAIRDVNEGVETYHFLLDKNELAAASQRLAEAFVVGEYLPSIRNLPREKKRQALAFTQKSNQLLSAIEVKDYTLAADLTAQLQKLATDFDASKPLAAIETARTLSKMHLAKAKIAAGSNDRATLEAELKAATEIWPRNPEVAQVSALIFNQADLQQQALNDLDRLISQRNLRQIFDDRIRFIAATALYPERQLALGKILEQMQQVEGAIIRATEISKRGDHAGAWEAAEKAIAILPDDPKLNQLRAQLTTEAAEFVRSLRTAQTLEEKNQLGSSLAWFLKSQRLYPPSEYAQEGIDRIVRNIIPEGN